MCDIRVRWSHEAPAAGLRGARAAVDEWDLVMGATVGAARPIRGPFDYRAVPRHGAEEGLGGVPAAIAHHMLVVIQTAACA